MAIPPEPWHQTLAARHRSRSASPRPGSAGRASSGEPGGSSAARSRRRPRAVWRNRLSPVAANSSSSAKAMPSRTMGEPGQRRVGPTASAPASRRHHRGVWPTRTDGRPTARHSSGNAHRRAGARGSETRARAPAEPERRSNSASAGCGRPRHEMPRQVLGQFEHRR